MYKISNGSKAKSVSETELVALTRSKKLKLDWFVRPADESDDWNHVGATSWVTSDNAAARTLYCANCDCRVVCIESLLNPRTKCPECKHSTSFVDYFEITEFDPEPPAVVFSHVPDVLSIATCLLICLLGIATTVSLFRDPSLSLLLGAFMAMAGGGFFAYSTKHRTDAKHYEAHLRRVENIVDQRTMQLQSSLTKLNGLERSLSEHCKRVTDEADWLIDHAESKATAEIRRAQSTAESTISREQSKASASDASKSAMAKKYLDEQCKWWGQKLKSDNFALQHGRVQKAIEFVRAQGYDVPRSFEKDLLKDLQLKYESVVRREAEKERQRQIREQIRAEQRAEKEAKEIARKAEEEQRRIEEEIASAMEDLQSQHSSDLEQQQAKIAELKRELEEAISRGQRAVSQAQLTRVGHVYIISNIGAFGEDVFKVGLTRRLEPLDRVKELGDASVPFAFDVHAMIFSEDAPTLEKALHQELNQYRVNRVNMRKEFFKVDLQKIIELATSHHGEIEYVIDAEALDYRTGLDMSEDDFSLVSRVAAESGVADDDDNDEG